jgi:hypothetical protein
MGVGWTGIWTRRQWWWWWQWGRVQSRRHKEAWDYNFYTGNGKVGHEVMKATSANLTLVTLELGGKSPTILDSHINLDITTRCLCWCIHASFSASPAVLLNTHDTHAHRAKFMVNAGP